MRFIDLFAGIGGFRRGMELAGHECVGFCEYDDFATASYTSMHLITEEQREYLRNMDKRKRQKEILKGEYKNGEWYAKDIKEVTGNDMPEAECWCFGAPCQSFSIAGKRAGLTSAPFSHRNRKKGYDQEQTGNGKRQNTSTEKRPKGHQIRFKRC